MRRILLIGVVILIFLVAVLATESSWDGDITESAATPLAEATGAQESHILPWRIEGDLLLFVFLAGGAIAGFAGGYYWRMMFAGDRPGVPPAAASGGDGPNQTQGKESA